MTAPPGDDKVGYGRPPMKTRWKKGQTGNPRKKPRPQASALETLDKLLLAPVKLTLNGETIIVSALEAIVSQLQLKDMSGNARATRVLLKYISFAAQHIEKRLELVFVDNEYTQAISNLDHGGSHG